MLDRLGVLLALLLAIGAALPFAILRANRIVPGEPLGLAAALPPAAAVLLALGLALAAAAALFRTSLRLKLVAGLATTALLSSFSASPRPISPLRISPMPASRPAPDSGCCSSPSPSSSPTPPRACALRRCCASWLARSRGFPRRPSPLGIWNDLSVLKEYAGRAGAFWQEARTHVVLALGSVAIATVLGVPIGILCYRLPKLRGAVLGGLNLIQTIPSIALFGLLIAPLAWLAANVPLLAAAGVSGIGAAPALVALCAYSLLPIVANTVVGLTGVSPLAIDAARGMGMTRRQRLLSVALPLALPVILTGIRIVLVQNIGLVTIAALIGGGGFGVFVFQGVGQSAVDLVLLGAVPTVVLAFSAAIVLDALIDFSRGGRA